MKQSKTKNGKVYSLITTEDMLKENGSVGPLRQKAVRGASAYLVSQFSSLCIQLVSTIILGRLLTPSDFGLVAMVTFFSIVLMNFGFNGFTEAIIQNKELSHKQVSTIFWINLGISLVLALLLVAAAPFLARFYHEPRLTQVAIVMSLTIVFSSLSTQHLALMKRNMNFWKVGLNDIFASLLSVGIAVAAAMHGFGYWSIVARQLSLAFLTAAGAWFLSKWTPTFPDFKSDIRSIVSFAVRVYINFSLNYFAKNLDKALIGWWHGSQILGFYDRAAYLLGVPLNPISSLTDVAISTLSKLRSDPERYLRYCSRILSLLSLIGMLLSAVFFVTAKDLVLVLIGPQWDKTGDIFRIFSIGLGVMMVYNVQGWFHLSLGTTNRWLKWTFFGTLFKICFICAALPWGLTRIAEAYVTAYYLLCIFGVWYAGRPMDMRFSWILSQIVRPFLAGLGSAIVSFFLLQSCSTIEHMNILLRIFVTAATCSTVYIVIIIVLYRGIKPLRECYQLLTDLLPVKRFKTNRASEETSN